MTTTTNPSQDQLADLNVSAFVAKRLGIRLATAYEIPTDALMAMSRYINDRERSKRGRTETHFVTWFTTVMDER